MTKHPFLSEDWIEAARAIYAAHRDRAPAVTTPLRANLNITDVPFGSTTLAAHLDTSTGELELELGHLSEADVTLTLGYETAKAQIVSQDQQAVIQAFMAGKIKIEGDITKVMTLATGTATTPEAQAVARDIATAIQAITE